MGHILTVYSQSAYKDYLLPAVVGTNYNMTLQKDLFQLKEDVTLKLENLQGNWRVLPDGEFRFFYTGSQKDAVEQPLRDSDICSLVLPAGEQMTVVMKITDQFFRAFDKFDLHSVNHVSIGTSPENTIQYEFMNVISATHAVLSRKNDAWQTEDRSRNGLFVNARRVSGAKEFAHGDLINIFGLPFVFLGDVLAIDTHLEGLQIRKNLSLFVASSQSMVKRHGEENDTYLFCSAPRYLPKLALDTVKIEGPPSPKEENRQSLALTIATPMLFGSGLKIFRSWFKGSASSAFMYTALSPPSVPLSSTPSGHSSNLRQAKKKLREDKLKRFEVYGEYLISCTNKVQEKYKKNKVIRFVCYKVHGCESKCVVLRRCQVGLR